MRHTANLLALLCAHDVLVVVAIVFVAFPPACLRAQLVRVELRPATTPVFTSLRVCMCVFVVVAGIFASRLLIQHFAYSRVVQFAIIRSN